MQGLHKSAHGQREYFVRAVTDQHIFRAAAVQLREFFPQFLGGRIGIQPQASVHRRLDRREHAGRGWVGVFIGVELDQAFDPGLFSGNVGVKLMNERADECGVCHLETGTICRAATRRRDV